MARAFHFVYNGAIAIRGTDQPHESQELSDGPGNGDFFA